MDDNEHVDDLVASHPAEGDTLDEDALAEPVRAT